MWYETQVSSETEVPTELMQATGRYGSQVEKMFRPVAWSLHFDWDGVTPIVKLVGPRLTGSGQPYLTGEKVGTVVPLPEVPVAVRRELAAKLQANLDSHVTKERAKIVKVLEGL